MANPIIDSLQSEINGYFNLLYKFLDVCPLKLWNSTFGGWPIWQQLYHTLWVNDLFIPLESPPPLVDIPAEVTTLKVKGESPIPVDKMKKIIAESHKLTLAYLDSLTDQDLSAINNKVRNVMHQDWSHAATIAKLSSHALYHIGIFDAALREKNLPGVF
ncbi:MAG: DinB family protein [Deltaproteobacteria bacterium]|jgi:hypothetical protein|nr:DinB family protein [Deltaproteobacteria bacterium]